MKKVSFIFGTRPEGIKLAPVILAMRERSGLTAHVCVTGQHRQMLDQVLDVFGITPDVDLALMQPDQTLASLTSRSITAIGQYLEEHRPDLVLVQGDTTTVFCAALAAFYHRVPVGHVEAGLRTWNKFAPYPEEINRVLTTRLADYHFAPTDWSRDNLLREGVPAGSIFVTGNTVIDALHLAVRKVQERMPEIPGLPKELMNGQAGRPLVLITGHRRESFGDGFERICRAIAALAGKFPHAAFVYPVHLNPNVREPVFRLLGGRDNIHLLEPLSYLPFVAMMNRATVILTDSGGVQEEAPSLGKPVLVMRETTERPEGVQAGAVRLVGTDCDKIIAEATALLSDPGKLRDIALRKSVYGDGTAAKRIVQVCAQRVAALFVRVATGTEQRDRESDSRRTPWRST